MVSTCISCVHTTSASNSSHQQGFNSSSYNCSSISPTTLLDSSLSKHEHPVALNLSSKDINIDHLNIQGIYSEKLSKFSELEVLLTATEIAMCIFLD